MSSKADTVPRLLVDLKALKGGPWLARSFPGMKNLRGAYRATRTHKASYSSGKVMAQPSTLSSPTIWLFGLRAVWRPTEMVATADFGSI